MGLSELIVTILIGLMIFGPRHIAGLAQMVGKITAYFRSFTAQINSQIEQEIKQDRLEKNKACAEIIDRQYQKQKKS